MNLNKKVIIYCLLLVFFMVSNNTLAAKITTTDVACSSIHSISINQIYVPGGSGEGYIELYVNAAQYVQDWIIYYEDIALNVADTGIVYRNGVALTGADNPMPDVQAGDFIIFYETEFAGKTNTFDQSQGEILLVDGSGDAVHYLQYFNNNNDSWYWNVPASCSTIYDQSNASGSGVCSMPDGSSDDKDWSDCDDSEGTWNDTSSTCVLGSFTITQADSALACPQTPAQVDIQALCSDGSIKTDYAGSVSLATTPNTTPPVIYDTSSKTNIINSITFDGSSGQVTVYLYHNEEELVTVTATDGALSNSGSGTNFYAYGFLSNTISSPMTSCTTSPASQLTAFGQISADAGCAVIENFSGLKAVKIWSEYINPNANDSNTQVRINGAAIPLIESSTSSLTFSNGVADYTINYPDAGQMQLHFKFDQDPYDGAPFNAMLHDSNLFTVVPAGLRIFSDDADADCVSGDGSCTKFKKAGETFNLKINAYCESDNPAGPVTPNFQLNNIDLTHSLVSPSGGTPGSLAVNSFSISDADNGIHTINNQSISEVGVFQLHTAALDYLGISDAIAASSSENIGRFYPSYFLMTANIPVVNDACSPDYTYLGQAFNFITEPQLTITAKGMANNTLSNYAVTGANGFWNLDSASAFNRSYTDTTGMSTLNNTSINSDDGIVDPQGSLNFVVSGNDTRMDFDANSIMTINGDYLKYDRVQVAPFDAAFDLTFLAAGLTDTDGACYKADTDADLNFDEESCTDLIVSVTSSAEQRLGRLRVDNAYGSEYLPLKDIKVSAEYYDGTSFTHNSSDSCTIYNSSVDIDWAAAATIYSGISNGDIEATGSGTLSAGSGIFTIHKTSDITLGPGNTGYADYNFQTRDWLKYDWQGTGDSDPRPRASFGIYNRSKRLIYTREIY